MALVIGSIVTETTAAPPEQVAAPGLSEAEVEAIVHRATERVLQTLRREWDA